MFRTAMLMLATTCTILATDVAAQVPSASHLTSSNDVSFVALLRAVTPTDGSAPRPEAIAAYGELCRRIDTGALPLDSLSIAIQEVHGATQFQVALLLGERAANRASAESRRGFLAALASLTIGRREWTTEERVAHLFVLGRTVAICGADAQLSAAEVARYGQSVTRIAEDRGTDPEIRRAAIKAVAEMDYRDAAPALLGVLRNESPAGSKPVLRSAALALSRLHHSQAIPDIASLLHSTPDREVFASAALALADLGGGDAVRALVQNSKRFDEVHTRVALRHVQREILHLLNDGGRDDARLAVDAVCLLGEGGHSVKGLASGEQAALPSLETILSASDDDTVHSHVLRRLLPCMTRERAQRIVAAVPLERRRVLAWREVEDLAASMVLQDSGATSPAEAQTLSAPLGDGDLLYQEYGDPGYCELNAILVGGLGHAALFAGLDASDDARVLEVTGASSYGIQDDSRSGLATIPGYWGAYALAGHPMTFAERSSVVATAVELSGYDIGYPLFPYSDCLDYRAGTGEYVLPSDIVRLRCDGLVEYCYERNGLWVWGPSAANYDVSAKTNVAAHNNPYLLPSDDPNTRLAPVVQCGRAGGYSTNMTISARISWPTYKVSVTYAGNVAHVYVNATDESGIHYIRMRVSGGSWVYSWPGPQHPWSDTFTYDRYVDLPENGSKVLYYSAMDNGGNEGGSPQSVTLSDTLWASEGIPVCTQPYSQRFPKSISDGAGGAIIAWADDRGATRDIYAQRVNAEGARQWTPDGVPLCTAAGDQEYPTIAADGSSGAIVTWYDYRNGAQADVYAQRVDAAGVPQWTSDGLPVCTAAGAQLAPQVASTPAGGAFITWQDARGGGSIYAQYVTPSGSALWTSDGIAICAGTSTSDGPMITSDGSYGAIITWEDSRNSSQDIYAQRVGQAITPKWTANGIAICAASGSQWYPTIISDGAGGAIVTWDDVRGASYDIYAQRVNSDGVTQWTGNGVALCTAANNQRYPILASDGLGGAIVTWQDSRGTSTDIYAQRVNASGSPQWISNGVPICTAADEQLWPAIASVAGGGGAVICWQDQRPTDSYMEVYAQQVGNAGNIMSQADGTRVCLADGHQTNPNAASDGNGGAIVVWEDRRSGNANRDIYAAHIVDGVVPVLISVAEVQADPGRVRLIWYAADGGGLAATVYRCTGSGAWRALGEVSPDGTGQIVYEDRDVSPGTRYGYRLGLLDEGQEIFVGETWVEVPLVAQFALGGVRPNPAARELDVAFSLPDASPARLEAFDLAGRRVATREVGPLGVGNHVVRLGEDCSLAPGVYLLRLTRGNSALTTRVVVIH